MSRRTTDADGRPAARWGWLLLAGVAVVLASTGTVAGGGWSVLAVPLLLGMGTDDRLHDLREQLDRLGVDEPPLDFDDADGADLEELSAVLATVTDALQDRERSLQRRRRDLAAERDRLWSLFEHTTDCVAQVELTDDVVLRRVNDRFAATFGLDEDAADGVILADVVGVDDESQLERPLRDGRSVERELRCRTADGPGHFHVRVVPVRPGEDPPGGIDGHLVFTEITDRRIAEARRRKLYDITSDTDRSAHEKIDRVLELGCEWFGVDNALLSRIDEADGRYHVEQSVGDDFPGAGSELPLGVTFCRRTIDTDGILGIFDAITEGLAADPGHAESGIACYIGGRVEVDGDLYGTLCYFDEDPKADPFDETQRALVDLIARWVGQVVERRQHRRALESLNETSSRLLRAESVTESAELVVETVAGLPGSRGAALYRFDTKINRLDPIVVSDGFVGAAGERPTAVGKDGGPLWDAYVTGTRRTVDAETDDGASPGDVDSALVVPVGTHGVLVVRTAPDPEAATVARFVDSVATTTEAAFDRLEVEPNLRDREAELESRNRRLERQTAINEIHRRIDRSLVAAESRSDVEATVCERLADADDVVFAWVGRVDPETGTVTPRAVAGDGGAYLDEIALDAGSDEPAARTARRGDATVVETVTETVGDDDWRRPALDAGFRSALAVPLSYEEYEYGVLAVYADEPDVFGSMERSVFAEFGETIGTFVNAVASQQALDAAAARELTLSFDEFEPPLAQLADETGWTLEFEGVGTHDADETTVFVTAADGDAPDALDGLDAVADHRVVTERDTDRLVELTVEGETMASLCRCHGAGLRSMRASDGDVEAVVDLPQPRDVREFLALLSEHYPSVELVAKEEVDRSAAATVPGSLLEELTDRQREVLRTAFLAGYFEFPRESTGEDVAEMLGISQPAVNRHVRLSLGSLLAHLFEQSAVE